MKSLYALVDCNSFFCSCERVFRPELNNRPVGVLSNNDGCFVSLSRELKALGVPMGAPYFKYKKVCRENRVQVFSSNFSLYTNMSDRVMLSLLEFTPELEVYSVDEAFLNLSGFQHLKSYAKTIKDSVEQWTGIPVSIGIAPTKTLAKIANYYAKKNPQTQGVSIMVDKKDQDTILEKVPIGQVWGIGASSEIKLRTLGLKTAKDFRDYPHPKHIKSIMTKVGLQRKEELQGFPRFKLHMAPEKKKGIMFSRSFGKPVTDFETLREAVASYTTAACEKLRQQDSVCTGISVYARTSRYNQQRKYFATDTHPMLSATSDTRKVVKYAIQVLKKLYRAGYVYQKTSIQLSGIQDRDQAQMSLLEPYDNDKSEKLMKSMDMINLKYGPQTVFPAECGVNNSAWYMNRNFKSPNYVTGWSELRKVR